MAGGMCKNARWNCALRNERRLRLAEAGRLILEV
jgi:hypothetical protein